MGYCCFANKVIKWYHLAAFPSYLNYRVWHGWWPNWRQLTTVRGLYPAITLVKDWFDKLRGKVTVMRVKSCLCILLTRYREGKFDMVSLGRSSTVNSSRTWIYQLPEFMVVKIGDEPEETVRVTTYCPCGHHLKIQTSMTCETQVEGSSHVQKIRCITFLCASYFYIYLTR